MELLLERLARHSVARPRHRALIGDDEELDHGALWQQACRVGASLRARGVGPGDRVALLCELRVSSVVAFLGAVVAGACAVPLPTGIEPSSLAQMLRDADASVLAVSSATRGLLDAMPGVGRELFAGGLWALDFIEDGFTALGELRRRPAAGLASRIDADAPLDIIYSSGTTSAPKGIVHAHRMRAFQVARGERYGIGPDATMLLSTPLYSNTTLVALLPALALGGTAVLLTKFDARRFLELSEGERVTHAMLVPVQAHRILAEAQFERFDLSAYRAKLVTGAPMTAAFKRELLQRWPGRLLEIYGLTEGGCTTVLDAGAHPHKLATVGLPAEGVELRILDDDGQELGPGQVGEIAGRAVSMMDGYHDRPDLTRAITWRDRGGRAFYRTGDLGRVDEDGFVELCGRKKDVIISGGLNLHAADLERVLLGLEDVAEAAVVAAPSVRMGEMPVAFVVATEPGGAAAEDIAARANARLGKVQRLRAVVVCDELPRNALGKVRKDELRRRLEDVFRG